MKLSLILGGLLLVSVAGSAWYIDRLLDEISVLKGNAITLENQIEQQNAAIKKHIENAKTLQENNNKLSAQNQESAREVQKLRNTFANHDLDALAIAKPQLIENRVNKAVARLKNELIQITDPKLSNLTRKMKNLITILSLTALIQGCSMIPTQTKPVEVVTIAEPMPIYHPPLPLEVQLVDVDWTVLTPESDGRVSQNA